VLILGLYLLPLPDSYAFHKFGHVDDPPGGCVEIPGKQTCATEEEEEQESFTFDIILSTYTVNIKPGETKSITIDVVKLSGTPEKITIAKYGYLEPSPLSLDFSHTALSHFEIIPDPKFSTTLTLTAESEITPGNYEFEIAGYIESKDEPQVQKFITVNVEELEPDECDFEILPRKTSATVVAGQSAPIVFLIKPVGECTMSDVVLVSLTITSGSEKLRQHSGDWYFYPTDLKYSGYFPPFDTSLVVKTTQLTPPDTYLLRVVADKAFQEGIQKYANIDLIVQQDIEAVGTIIETQNLDLYKKQPDGSWSVVNITRISMNAIEQQGTTYYRTPDGTFQPLTGKIPILPGYVLTTGVDGKLTVGIASDNVEISENSELKILKNNENQSVVELIQGKIKVKYQEIMNTPSKIISILVPGSAKIQKSGTEFTVNHDADTNTTIVELFEGSLKITPEATPQEQDFEAPNSITIKKGQITDVTQILVCDVNEVLENGKCVPTPVDLVYLIIIGVAAAAAIVGAVVFFKSKKGGISKQKTPKFCGKCGIPTAPSNKFCKKCGNVIIKTI